MPDLGPPLSPWSAPWPAVLTPLGGMANLPPLTPVAFPLPASPGEPGPRGDELHKPCAVQPHGLADAFLVGPRHPAELLSEVGDLKIAPMLLEVLRDQPTMTVVRLVLAAEQASV